MTSVPERHQETTTTKPSRLTLPIVLAAQFVTPMSISGTAIALPEISSDLGAQPTALQWVVNGFNVAFALGVLAWGALSDQIGYRLTFTLGAVSFAVGSAASTAAGSLVALDVARIFAGLGAAAVLTGASSMISNAFHGASRTKAFALFGTVNGLGLALGPSISGVLVSGAGWRGVFLVQAAVLAVVVVSCGALPGDKAGGRAPNDGARTPLIDLALLRNREFLAMCLVPVAGSVGFVTLLTYLPSAFSGIKSMPSGAAGLTMLAMTVPVLVAPMAVAKLITQVRSVDVGLVVHVSLGALIVGNLGMLLLSENRSTAWVIVPMILLGLGFGLPIGLVDGHALAVVPTERAGTAAGVLNFFRIGTEAIFVAGYSFILTTILGRRLSGAAAENTAAGQPGQPEVYRNAFDLTVLGVTAVLIVLTIAIVLIRRSAFDSRLAKET